MCQLYYSYDLYIKFFTTVCFYKTNIYICSMNNKFLLTTIALAFWAVAIILSIHFFDFSNPFKSDTNHEEYMKSFNNRLCGTWMRTTDSLQIKYISNPTNSFIVLNTTKFLYKDDTLLIKSGFIKINDIEVSDTINNVYDIDYLRDDMRDSYNGCILFLINDSNIIIKRQSYDISDTYIKIK